MPSRIFGLDLRRVSLVSSDPPASIKTGAVSSVAELTRPSMDFKRPALVLGKKHNSHGKKSEKDRAPSKDKQGKDGPRSSLLAQQAVQLNLLMESPPALFIDPPQVSTGALVSGRLQITPNSPEVSLSSITMYLEATTTVKHPVQERCRECATVVSDLYEWHFLTKPKLLRASEGMQELPFSHLIPGHLPATTHGQIGSIDYSLHVRAKTSDGRETQFRRELTISRALRPGVDRNSVRVFPPTNLTLHVALPSAVYPIGEFPVQCRMQGIITKRDDSQCRWVLRKVHWHIEEQEEMISPACDKHAAKVGGPGKGIKHEHTRRIGMGELERGWKTDLAADEIAGEFMVGLNSATAPQRDVDAANGLKVTHHLVLELVITEEWAANKKPQHTAATGAARVLRTQFKLAVTDRAGLGIAWDDETPPVYEDVPASPPHYRTENTVVLDYHGDALPADVEHLSLT